MLDEPSKTAVADDHQLPTPGTTPPSASLLFVLLDHAQAGAAAASIKSGATPGAD